MKEIKGRIEQFFPEANLAGIHSSVVPSAPAGLMFIGDKYSGVGVPDRGETSDMNNFAPRVGLAWDPKGNGKMSLRAGGGVFYYSRLPGLFLNDAAISAPFSLRIDLNDSKSGTSQIGGLADPLVNYPSFYAAGFPQRYTLKDVPSDARFIANPTVFGLQPGVKWVTPEIYDWNITFERQLRSDTVAHVSYVGTRGTHLRQDVNLNPGFYTPGSGSVQSTRRYQPFGVIYQNRNNGANAYNGLQLDLEKRPNGGSGILNQITLLTNYTYSHSNDYGLSENGGITDIGSSIGSGMSFYDPRQHAFETGPSTFDRRHHLVASYVWNLPKLGNASGLVRNLVGNWQWTGIYTFSSGDPLTLLAGKDQSQTGNNLDRVDYNGSGKPGSKGTPTACPAPSPGKIMHCVPFVDTSALALPSAGTYGNSGKGSWRGPNLWDVDTGLIKNFYPVPSHERYSFQFRGELFNVLNHPQFSDPVATYCTGNSCFFGNIRTTIGTAAGNVAGTADSRIIQLALKMNF